MSVCPVSSLVLCMSRFVKARSSRWNRGTLGPNLSKPPLPCGKRVCIEEGPHVEILNLPEHRESIQNRSLGTFDTKGLLGISWTYSGIALQVTWPVMAHARTTLSQARCSTPPVPEISLKPNVQWHGLLMASLFLSTLYQYSFTSLWPNQCK